MIDNQLSFTQSAILDNIKIILENSIVKLSVDASKYDTLDIIRASDKYLNAKQELDIFESHPYYEPSHKRGQQIPE